MRMIGRQPPAVLHCGPDADPAGGNPRGLPDRGRTDADLEGSARRNARSGVATSGERRARDDGAKPAPRVTVRIDFAGDRAIGPGKIKLLELIDAVGSISAAGRRMGMSYRRAWLLVDSLNRCFREPLVAAHHGGAHGGGAVLTEAGAAVIRHYRAVEAAAHSAGAAHLDALAKALADQAGGDADTVSDRLPPDRAL
jgi:molybdate transport system regulatory protein